MSIVVITIPGSAKEAFVTRLNQETKGKVELVLVQKWKPDSYGSLLKRLSKKGFFHLLEELWCALLLRLLPATRNTLNYFREGNLIPKNIHTPKTIVVSDINSDEVFTMLKKISPDLLVVWGSKILAPRLIGTAKRAVNLHMGRCPYYRGTLANQLAVLENDRAHIGATVHYVEEHVDAGPILTVIQPDLSRPPRALFRDLNDRAQAAYIDIVSRLVRGENMQSIPQDGAKGKNLLMREWTPYVRYHVAREMRRWECQYEKEGKASAVAVEVEG